MGNTEVLDVLHQMFLLVVKLGCPFLVVSMVVGIIISIFQAATQINEQTMTFVPKLLSIFVMLAVFGSSMLVIMQDFMRNMILLGLG